MSAPAPGGPPPPPNQGSTASVTSSLRAKFKPRNLRRNEEERAELARQEERKLQERLEQEAKGRPRARRGARGRGAAMGHNSSGRGGGGASSSGTPLSSTSSSASSINFGRGKGGFRGGRGSHREARINADKVAVSEAHDVGLDDPHAQEAIEDDHVGFFEDRKYAGMAPVGIYRAKPELSAQQKLKQKQQESAGTASTSTTTTSSTSTPGTATPAAQLSHLTVSQRIARAYAAMDETRDILDESVETWETNVLDSPTTAAADPPQDTDVWSQAPANLAQLDREEPIDFDANRREIKATGPEKEESLFVDDDDDEIMDKDHDRTKARVKAAIQHQEALSAAAPPAEMDPEVQLLLHEFANTKIVDTTDPDDQGTLRDGRLYFFQFPPTLPPLGSRPPPPPPPPSTEDRKGSLKVKDADGEDAIMLDQIPEAPKNIDLTQSGSNSSSHSGTATPSVTFDLPPEQHEPEPLEYDAEPSGYVGRMLVRKSGAVEMEWGGVRFRMAPAFRRSTVRSGALVEAVDAKGNPLETWEQGDSMELGKIMGEFALTPDISYDNEWAIAPEDLEP